LLHQIRERIERHERVLVTTLTKRMAEDLTDYYSDLGVRVRYLHSDVDTLERMEILRSLRKGEFDVLVGINLLREGLDLPEVSLVAILDADKEGFLRSERSLIQTSGRAARNAGGQVIFYADRVTDSMARAIGETERRRKIQQDYNERMGITPKTIEKAIPASLVAMCDADYAGVPQVAEEGEEYLSEKELAERLDTLEEEMLAAARELEFERAAELGDRLIALKDRLVGVKTAGAGR